jgi:hypothetical protein
MGSWNAKALLAAAVALVVGLVLGGLGPRTELRELREQVAELERHPVRRDVGRQIFGEVFAPRASPAAGDGAAPPEPEDVADRGEPASDPEPGEPERGFRVEVDRPGGQVPAEQVDQMKDALDMRRAQAVAALREQAGASDEQMAEVDEIVAAMNADLEVLAEEFVATVSEGEPSRRDMMSFAADTLDVLIDTEDRLGGVLDDEQLEAVSDEALDPTAYVDGAIVDVLSRLDR